MEAQNFFKMCNDVVSSLSVKPVSSFSQDFASSDKQDSVDTEFIDESEFIEDFIEEGTQDDFEDDFSYFLDDEVKEGQDKQNKSVSLTAIKNVNITKCVVKDVSNMIISEFFFHNLNDEHRRVFVGDYVRTWNDNFVKQLDNPTQVLREYILMMFGISFRQCECNDLEKLKVVDLERCGPLPITINISEFQRYLQMVDESYDPFVVAVFSTLTDFDSIKSLMSLDDYSYDEAKEFCYDARIFNLYIKAKLEGIYDEKRFKTVLHDCNLENFWQVYQSEYVDFNAIIKRRTDINPKLLQKAISEQVITKEWLSDLCNVSILGSLLTARINHIHLEWFEKQAKTNEVPNWLTKMYLANELKHLDGKRMWCSILENDISIYVGKSMILSDELGARNLISAYKDCHITPKDYMEFILLVSESEKTLSYMHGKVAPFNKFWFNEIALSLGLDTSVSSNVGSMLIVADNFQHVKLLDSFCYARDVVSDRKWDFIMDMRMIALNNNSGYLLYNKNIEDKVTKLLDFKYIARSSVEYWADRPDIMKSSIAMQQYFDIHRINLLRVIEKCNNNELHEQLKWYLTCSLQQYLAVDRAFGQIADKLHDLVLVANTKYLNTLLKSILKHQTDSMQKFVLLFLHDILSDLGKLELQSCKGLGTLNRIHITCFQFDKDISITSFLSGFDGFMTSFIEAKKVLLGVKNGNIFMKICQ